MMAKDTFTLKEVFPVSAQRLYEAWLDSEEHAAFIGGEASIEPKEGGRFTAWGDYISGKILRLETNYLIKMAWRTTEFSKDAEDSIVEVRLEDHKDGTQLTLKHRNIPARQGDKYKEGWQDFYFEPMHEYFG